MHYMNTKLNKGTNPTFVGQLHGHPKAQIQPGDSLKTNCIFDTRDKKEPTTYGTNHGEEMCGFLMMYYPHDWTRIKHHESTCIDEFDNPNSP